MYKIVGADQKEYGPVTEEQVRQWIADGRANGQTIARFGDGPWKPLATFPEFASVLPPVPPPATAPTAPGAPPAPLSLPLPGSVGPVVPPTNGMAIAGLICSILGLFCCGPIFSTLGLILSLVGVSQITQNPAQYSGKGIAIAGIVVAIAGYAIFAILLFTGLLQRTFRSFPR